jgi:hypothetical protein
METPSVDKISAYTRICQKFASACGEEAVDPVDCWLAIGRFLNVQPTAFPSTAPESPRGSARNIALTPKEAEEAKRLARIAKAKAKELTPKEVNLTPQEVKIAKAQYRERLQASSSQPRVPISGNVSQVRKRSPPPPTTVGDGGKPPTSEKLETPTSSEIPKKKVGVQQDKSGSRATAKTKIDNLRRTTLRSNPIALDLPSALHLVAYANHRHRLLRQWEEYCKIYESSGILDPLRGLPDPWKGTKVRNYLSLVSAGLREQSDSPGTFILQSDSGASYWDRDKPSEACPDLLQKAIPNDVMDDLVAL